MQRGFKLINIKRIISIKCSKPLYIYGITLIQRLIIKEIALAIKSSTYIQAAALIYNKGIRTEEILFSSFPCSFHFIFLPLPP